MTSVRRRQPRGVPVGGQFAVNERGEADTGLNIPLADQTPVQVDEQLAEIYGRKMDARISRLAVYRSMCDHANSTRFRLNRELTDEEMAGYQKKIEEYEAIEEACDKESSPFTDEFDRRGGWTRAFLVMNADGHVHSSQRCGTLHPTTCLRWVTDYSGKTQDEVIDDAGEMACTRCYPDAPLRPSFHRPSKIVDEDEVERRRAASAAKAEREKKAQDKSITAPDGGDLRVDGWHIKTEFSAVREASSRAESLVFDGIREIPNRAYVEQMRRELSLLERAIANKRGVTQREVHDELVEKARKKTKRDLKGTDYEKSEIPTIEMPETDA